MSDTVASIPKADLTGKVAVVTGAGSEIGLALALHAADRRMKVALADADPSLLASAHEAVKATNVETLAECTEEFDLAALRNLVRRTEQELGPPWLACNSGGSTIEANLWGVIHGVQVFTPRLVNRAAGHIVNIASNLIFRFHAAAVGIAVNHAIVGLSESLYRELDLLSSPVGVTVVCPNINSRIACTCGVQNSMYPLALEDTLPIVPPKELAEQIFSAVERREFWVSPHTNQMHETTYTGPYAASSTRVGRYDRSGNGAALAVELSL